MTPLAVQTQNLSKYYGDVAVVDDLSMSVPEGSIYGFIGSNGAGKTTTIRILLGFAAASSGSATVLGLPRGTLPSEPSPQIAYLPDVPRFAAWMKPIDALIYLGRISGVEPDLAVDRAHDLLDLVGLSGARGSVGGFSRGMSQRLGIAASLIGAPRLLVLDEPTSALDPIGRADVLAIIKQLRGQVTVLFTSHLLADVQNVCDHVGLLHKGKLVLEGELQDVLATHRSATTYLRLPGDKALRDALERQLGIPVTIESSTLQDVYEAVCHEQQ
ncbi:ABC transporter ATP-binding protein [Corynebacterium pseudotuberculosis]|uniref:ABC transporter ATP-binding protein n=1 Tax=Corynebacterium pseudotuberculosis TaxID=1719 RepID=UPI000737CCC2|nr:ABC transporter ATP-binding protein [Corynebacterium pseudotuberculosis]ALU21284.1 ABC transporter ATP-binding protein [Corynebacterium pseudotuberculosis]ANH23509.1 ABC transporter ATP-binding protein YxlF [Corynebacterium pseudotuberculosis]